MFYFDYTYLLFMIPCIIVSTICQIRVKQPFQNMRKSPTRAA